MKWLRAFMSRLIPGGNRTSSPITLPTEVADAPESQVTNQHEAKAPIKVDVAVCVYGKPFQTAVTLASLLRHSGHRIDRIFLQEDPEQPFGEAIDYIKECFSDRNIFQYKPSIKAGLDTVDFGRLLSNEEYRLAQRYQVAWEESKKDFLFVCHNDCLFTVDIIGAMLAVAQSGFVGVGEIGQCWNCPAHYAGLCAGPLHEAYAPSYEDAIEVVRNHPGPRTPEWAIDKNSPMPFPECRLNEWACLINVGALRREVLPFGPVLPFGAMTGDTGTSWFRDLRLRGYRFADFREGFIHAPFSDIGSGHIGGLKFDLYCAQEERAKQYLTEHYPALGLLVEAFRARSGVARKPMLDTVDEPFAPEPKPDRDTFAFLSFWGQVLTYQPDNKMVSMRSLLDTSSSNIVLVSRDAFYPDSVGRNLPAFAVGNEVPDWKLAPTAVAGCYSFEKNNKFIGAGLEGHHFLADIANEWEAFLPISLEDLSILRKVLLRRFHQADESGSGQGKLGLRHFKLLWNNKEFPLALNCPLRERLDGATIRLDSVGISAVLTESPTEVTDPLIWIHPHGSIANRALQYLAAEGIRQYVPEAIIQNNRMEMWGIDDHAARPSPDSCASTGTGIYSIDVKGLGTCLARRQAEALIIDSYTFNIDHYPPRPACRRLISRVPGTQDVEGFGEDELLCSVRGAEILTNIHGLYFPLPPAYYRMLQKQSGLKLVFYGQLEADAYSEGLRRAFPEARFITSRGAGIDFETIRKSRNIALPISTFAWLAAWLSEAINVYVPVGGLFNPMLEPGQSFLPIEEPSFQYVMLPRVLGENLFDQPTEFWAVQDNIAKFSRFATQEEIRELLARANATPRAKRAVTGPFEASYYQAHHSTVAYELLGLNNTALGWYLQRGYLAGDRTFHFDDEFYRHAYPDVEIDIALGRFTTLVQHFLEKGQMLGYQPRPHSG